MRPTQVRSIHLRILMVQNYDVDENVVTLRTNCHDDIRNTLLNSYFEVLREFSINKLLYHSRNLFLVTMVFFTIDKVISRGSMQWRTCELRLRRLAQPREGRQHDATGTGYRHSEKVAMIMITHCPAINLCALCFFSTIYQKTPLYPLHTLCFLCNINKQVKCSRHLMCIVQLFPQFQNFMQMSISLSIQSPLKRLYSWTRASACIIRGALLLPRGTRCNEITNRVVNNNKNCNVSSAVNCLFCSHRPRAGQFDPYRENNRRKRSPIKCTKKKLIVRDYGLWINDCRRARDVSRPSPRR